MFLYCVLETKNFLVTEKILNICLTSAIKIKIMSYSVIKTKKVVEKYKVETLESIWIDVFVALRKKIYAFNCGDDSKNKKEGICKSQATFIKFEE